MNILCSTGVFTRTSDPLSHEAILRYGPQFVVDGFEVIVYPRWYDALAQVARTLHASPLVFPAIHVEKSVGDGFGNSNEDAQEQALMRFERNCFFAHEVGAGRVVLHLWGMPESDTYFERNLRLLPRCLDVAERYGLELAVETIPCASADPLTNVRRAYEQDTRMRVALDTEFLAMHGLLGAVFDAAWLWRAPLVTHVHLKDYAAALPANVGRRYLHPGEGEIDFAHFVRQLKAHGFDGALCLEARGIDGENRVEVARIAASLEMIRALAVAV